MENKESKLKKSKNKLLDENSVIHYLFSLGLGIVVVTIPVITCQMIIGLSSLSSDIRYGEAFPFGAMVLLLDMLVLVVVIVVIIVLTAVLGKLSLLLLFDSNREYKENHNNKE